MKIAKIHDNNVLEVGEHTDLFPNTSFADTGPNTDFMVENSCIFAYTTREYDAAIEKLIITDWYIDNGAAYNVAVKSKSDGEIGTDLSSIRVRICDTIKSIRDYKTQNGGYKAGLKWFHSDTFSRTQQLGLRLEGENLPPGIMWKTLDGSFVEMTPVLAQQIFSAAVAQDTALFSYAEYLQALVNVAADPSSIDITVGWPETFNNV